MNQEAAAFKKAAQNFCFFETENSDIRKSGHIVCVSEYPDQMLHILRAAVAGVVLQNNTIIVT